MKPWIVCWTNTDKPHAMALRTKRYQYLLWPSDIPGTLVQVMTIVDLSIELSIKTNIYFLIDFLIAWIFWKLSIFVYSMTFSGGRSYGRLPCNTIAIIWYIGSSNEHCWLVNWTLNQDKYWLCNRLSSCVTFFGNFPYLSIIWPLVVDFRVVDYDVIPLQSWLIYTKDSKKFSY